MLGASRVPRRGRAGTLDAVRSAETLGREAFLRRAGIVVATTVGGILAATPSAAAGPGCAGPDGPIVQPARRTPRSFMDRAEAMRDRAVADGDQSYGAVVVRRGRLVGLGPSRVVTSADPTAHAEMEAIRDAACRLGTADLTGCVLYATSRPCPMCETAAVFARITRIVVGHDLVNIGAPVYGGR